jgi:glycosyltransferase involved in cell wall biosynthesis
MGELVPEQRHHLAIEAFHVLTTWLVPRASLIVAGSVVDQRFADVLRAQIAELNLQQAMLVATTSMPILAALLQRAEVLVTVAQEGPVPALDRARQIQVPVVATGECTNKPGVLLLPTDTGPVLLAEAIAELLIHPQLRRQIATTGGRER